MAMQQYSFKHEVRNFTYMGKNVLVVVTAIDTTEFQYLLMQ